MIISTYNSPQIQNPFGLFAFCDETIHKLLNQLPGSHGTAEETFSQHTFKGSDGLNWAKIGIFTQTSNPGIGSTVFVIPSRFAAHADIIVHVDVDLAGRVIKDRIHGGARSSTQLLPTDPQVAVPVMAFDMPLALPHKTIHNYGCFVD